MISLFLKVLLHKGFQAYGLEYEDQLGRIGEIKAKHGIILSAGVIGSAKILLQSGIGPRNHLESLNVSISFIF